MMTLRELRFHKEVSQLEVAFAVGMSQTKFSLIERGYLSPKRIEREKIAQFFGTSSDEILWGGRSRNLVTKREGESLQQSHNSHGELI